MNKVVLGVVEKDNKVLIVKRKKDDGITLSPSHSAHMQL